MRTQESAHLVSLLRDSYGHLKFDNLWDNDARKEPFPVYFSHITQMSETDVII